MATTTLNYVAKFSGDSSALKSTLTDLNKQLNNIANTRISVDDGQISSAADAAKDLQKYLTLSMDAKTGELDLTKLNSQLKAGGTSATELSKRLLALGPEGTTAFTTFATAVSQAQTPIKKTNALLDDMWVSMKNTVKWQLSSTALNSFTGAISSAVGFAKALDASLTSISIVTGKSTEEMAAFALQANEAARALNTTTVDYTDAALIYYQQGDSEDLVQEKTDITIKAANAAGMDAAEMSEYLTAVWNSYQVGAEELELYVDVMAKLGAETATSLEEISTAMQKVAATGNAVGVDFQQLSSILSTVSSVTRDSPETVGTAFKTIFARIGDLYLGESDEDGFTLGTVSSTLQKIGIDVLDASGELKDMGGVIEELGEKWQIMDTATQVAVAQAVAGKRQYTQLIALFDNWDDYELNLDMAYNSEGATQEMADTFETGWEAARKRLKTSFEGMILSTIQDIDLTAMANMLANIADVVARVIDSMGGLQNIVLLVSSTFVAKFQKNIVSAMKDVGSNFSLAIGSTEKEVKGTQSEVANVALEAAGGASSVESRQLELTNQIIKAKQLLADNTGKLSEQERQYAEALIEGLEGSAEEVLRLSGLAQDAQDATKQAKSSLIKDATSMGVDVLAVDEFTQIIEKSAALSDAAVKNTKLMNEAYNKFSEQADAKEGIKDLQPWGDTFKQNIEDSLEGVKAIQSTLVDDATSAIALSGPLEDYKSAIDEIVSDYSSLDLAADSSVKEMRELMDRYTAAQETLAQKVGDTSEAAQNSIMSLFEESIRGSEGAMEQVVADTDVAKTSMEALVETVSQIGNSTQEAMQKLQETLLELTSTMNDLNSAISGTPSGSGSGNSGSTDSQDLDEPSVDSLWSVDDYADSLETVSSLFTDMSETVDEASESLEAQQQFTEASIETLDRLQQAVSAYTNGMSSMANLNTEISGTLMENTEDINGSLGAVQGNMEELERVVGESSIGVEDAFTSIGVAGMSAITAFNGIKAAIDSFSDSDLSWSERLTGTMAGLAIAVPQLATAIGALNTIREFGTQVTERNTLAESLNSLAQGSSVASSAADTTAEVINSRATDDNTAAQGRNTVSVGLGSAAKALAATVTGGLTAATAMATKAIVAFSTAIKAVSGPIGWAVAGLTALASAGYYFVKTSNESKAAAEAEAQAHRDNAAAAMTESVAISKANTSLINSFSELLETYKETGEGKDELDAATQVLADAYGIEVSAVAALSGSYEDYYSWLLKVKGLKADEVRDGITTSQVFEASLQGSPAIELSVAKVGAAGDAVTALQDFLLENSRFDDDWLGDSGEYNEAILNSVTLKTDSISSIISTFGALTAAYEEALALELDDHDFTKSVKEHLDSLSDSYTQAMNALLLNPVSDSLDVIEALGANMSFDSYKTWSDDSKEMFLGLGYSEEEIASNMELIASITTFALGNFERMDAAITQVSKNTVLTYKEAQSLISKDEVDLDIVAAMDWSEIFNVADFENEYKRVSDLSVIEQAFEDLEQNLSSIDLAKSLVSSGANENYDELDGLFDWGGAETDFVKFANFMQMTAFQQTEFLNSLQSSYSYNTKKNFVDLKETTVETIELLEEKLSHYQEIMQAMSEDGDLDILQLSRDNAYYDVLVSDLALTSEISEAQSLLNKSIEDYNLMTEAKDNGDWIDIKAYAELASEIQDAKDKVKELESELSDLTDPSILIDIASNLDDEIERMEAEIMDLDLEATITIKTNMETAVDNIVSEMEQIQSITHALIDDIQKVGSNYLLTAEQAQVWADIYPAMLASATITTDGLMQLNAAEVDAYLAGMQAKYETRVEEQKSEIEDKIKVLETSLLIIQDEIKGYTTAANARTAIAEALNNNQVTLAEDAAQDEIGYSTESTKTAAINVQELAKDAVENFSEVASVVIQLNKLIAALGTADDSSIDWYARSIESSFLKLNSMVAGNWGVSDGLVSYNGGVISGLEEFGGDYTELLSTLSIIDDIMMSELLREEERYSAEIGSLKNLLLQLDTVKEFTWEYSGIELDEVLDELLEDAEATEEILEKIVEELIEVASRYHEITKEIEYQERVLSRIQTNLENASGLDKLKYSAEEIAQLEKLMGLYEEEAQAALAFKIADQSQLLSLDSTITFNEETGAISNYSDAYQRQASIYNAAVQTYNASEQTDEDKEIFAAAEKALSDWEDKTSAYESTQDIYLDTLDKIADTANELASAQLNDIVIKVELQTDISELQLSSLDYYLAKIADDSFVSAERIAYMAKQSQEYVKDIAAYTTGIEEIFALAGDNDLSSEQRDSVTAYMSALQDSQTALLDLSKSIKAEYVVAIEDGIAATENAISTFDTFNSVIEQQISLMELYGFDSSALGLDDIFSQAALDISMNKLTALQTKLESLNSTLEDAQGQLAAALASGDEDIAAYWEEQIEYITGLVLDAQTEMNDGWMDVLSLALDEKVAALEAVTDKFISSLISYDDTDSMSDALSRQLELQDRYLSTSEQIYELNKLNRNIESSIDSTSSIKGQQELLELQQEISDIQESGQQLNDYDLAYLQARYDLKLAELALEESQGTNTTMRLVRGADGNYKYAYTADDFDVSSAEQEYEDALRRLDELNEEREEELANTFVDLMASMGDDMAAILSDSSLTQEEMMNKLKELFEENGEDFEWFYENLETLMENSGKTFDETLLGMLTECNEFDVFMDQYAQSQQEAYESIDEAVLQWQDTVTEAAKAAGLEIEDFDEIQDAMTDNFITNAQDMASESVNLSDSVSTAMDAMTESIEKVVDALSVFLELWNVTVGALVADSEAYVEDTKDTLATQSGITSSSDDNDIDYTALIHGYMASGGEYGDSTYEQLKLQLLNKVAEYKEQGINPEYWGISSSSIDDIFKDWTTANYTGDNTRYEGEVADILAQLGIGAFDNPSLSGSYLDGILGFADVAAAGMGATSTLELPSWNSTPEVNVEAEVVPQTSTPLYSAVPDTSGGINMADSSTIDNSLLAEYLELTGVYNDLISEIDSYIEGLSNKLDFTDDVSTYMTILNETKETLAQTVNINADFSNVTSMDDIINAFTYLSEVAKQQATI